MNNYSSHFGGGGWTNFTEYMNEKTEKIKHQLTNSCEKIKTKIFENCCCSIDGRTEIADFELKKLIIENGGVFEPHISNEVTHVIADNISIGNQRWKNIKDRGGRTKKFQVVTSKWILDSIKMNQKLVERMYWPKELRPNENLFDYLKNFDKKKQKNVEKINEQNLYVKSSVFKCISGNEYNENCFESINNKSKCDNEKIKQHSLVPFDNNSNSLNLSSCFLSSSLNELSVSDSNDYLMFLPLPNEKSKLLKVSENVKTNSKGFLRNRFCPQVISKSNKILNKEKTNKNQKFDYDKKDEDLKWLDCVLDEEKELSSINEINFMDLYEKKFESNDHYSCVFSTTFSSTSSSTSSFFQNLNKQGENSFFPLLNESSSAVMTFSSSSPTFSRFSSTITSSSSPFTSSLLSHSVFSLSSYPYLFSSCSSCFSISSCSSISSTCSISSIPSYSYISSCSSILSYPSCSSISSGSSSCTLSSELLRNDKSRLTTAGNFGFVESFFRSSRLHFIGTWRSRVLNRFNFIPFSPLPHQNLFSNNSIFSFSKKNEIQKVLHIDFDAFFASVALKKFPHLKDKPVCVSHSSSNSNISSSRSDISSCNYIARAYGVKKGMWLSDAINLCPSIHILPYDFEQIEQTSLELLQILNNLTNRVLPISCDEAYVQLVGKKECEDVFNISLNLRKEIKDRTSCSVSIGIGENLLIAKLAGLRAKPNAADYIEEKQKEDKKEENNKIEKIKIEEGGRGVRGVFLVEDAYAFMQNKKLIDLPGVGYKIGEKLRKMKFETCKDILTKSNIKQLQNHLGVKHGSNIWLFCHGLDPRPIPYYYNECHEKSTPLVSSCSAVPDDNSSKFFKVCNRKSMSISVNWGVRLNDYKSLLNFLIQLASEAQRRLQEENILTSNIGIKLLRRAKNAPIQTEKFLGCGTCDEMTKKMQMENHVDDEYKIFLILKFLWDTHFSKSCVISDIRGMTVLLSKFILNKTENLNKNEKSIMMRKVTELMIKNSENNGQSFEAENYYFDEQKKKETSYGFTKNDVLKKIDAEKKKIAKPEGKEKKNIYELLLIKNKLKKKIDCDKNNEETKKLGRFSKSKETNNSLKEKTTKNDMNLDFDNQNEAEKLKECIDESIIKNKSNKSIDGDKENKSFYLSLDILKDKRDFLFNNYDRNNHFNNLFEKEYKMNAEFSSSVLKPNLVAYKSDNFLYFSSVSSCNSSLLSSSFTFPISSSFFSSFLKLNKVPMIDIKTSSSDDENKKETSVSLKCSFSSCSCCKLNYSACPFFLLTKERLENSKERCNDYTCLSSPFEIILDTQFSHFDNDINVIHNNDFLKLETRENQIMDDDLKKAIKLSRANCAKKMTNSLEGKKEEESEFKEKMERKKSEEIIEIINEGIRNEKLKLKIRPKFLKKYNKKSKKFVHSHVSKLSLINKQKKRDVFLPIQFYTTLPKFLKNKTYFSNCFNSYTYFSLSFLPLNFSSYSVLSISQPLMQNLTSFSCFSPHYIKFFPHDSTISFASPLYSSFLTLKLPENKDNISKNLESGLEDSSVKCIYNESNVHKTAATSNIQNDNKNDDNKETIIFIDLLDDSDTSHKFTKKFNKITNNSRQKANQVLYFSKASTDSNTMTISNGFCNTNQIISNNYSANNDKNIINSYNYLSNNYNDCSIISIRNNSNCKNENSAFFSLKKNFSSILSPQKSVGFLPKSSSFNASFSSFIFSKTKKKPKPKNKKKIIKQNKKRNGIKEMKDGNFGYEKRQKRLKLSNSYSFFCPVTTKSQSSLLPFLINKDTNCDVKTNLHNIKFSNDKKYQNSVLLPCCCGQKIKESNCEYNKIKKKLIKGCLLKKEELNTNFLSGECASCVAKKLVIFNEEGKNFDMQRHIRIFVTAIVINALIYLLINPNDISKANLSYSNPFVSSFFYNSSTLCSCFSQYNFSSSISHTSFAFSCSSSSVDSCFCPSKATNLNYEKLVQQLMHCVETVCEELCRLEDFDVIRLFLNSIMRFMECSATQAVIFEKLVEILSGDGDIATVAHFIYQVRNEWHLICAQIYQRFILLKMIYGS